MLVRTGHMFKSSTHRQPAAPRLQSSLAALAADQLESPGFAPTALLHAILTHVPGGYLRTVAEGQQLVLAVACKDRALPLPISETWITPITSSGVPIIAQADAPIAIKTLLRDVKRPLLLRELPVASKAFHLLKQEAVHFAGLTHWERACLAGTGSFDDWMSTTFDHKRRKEFKRLRARLGEMGELRSESLTARKDPTPFIDNLLRLESAGWKGQRGTALGQDAKLEAALRHGLNELHANDRLRFWQLSLNGQAIAALFAVVENGQATLGKIAYDEAYAKYSPGVLTILDASASLIADEHVQFADSNAIPDHPMINRIWRARHGFEDVVVAGDGVSSARFNATVFAEKQRLAARRIAKVVYGRVRGG